MDSMWNRLPPEVIEKLNAPIYTDTRLNNGEAQGWISPLEQLMGQLGKYQNQFTNRQEGINEQALTGLQDLFNRWYSRNGTPVDHTFPERGLQHDLYDFKGFSPGDRERMNRMFLDHMLMYRAREKPRYGSM